MLSHVKGGQISKGSNARGRGRQIKPTPRKSLQGRQEKPNRSILSYFEKAQPKEEKGNDVVFLAEDPLNAVVVRKSEMVKAAVFGEEKGRVAVSKTGDEQEGFKVNEEGLDEVGDHGQFKCGTPVIDEEALLLELGEDLPILEEDAPDGQVYIEEDVMPGLASAMQVASEELEAEATHDDAGEDEISVIRRFQRMLDNLDAINSKRTNAHANAVLAAAIDYLLRPEGLMTSLFRLHLDVYTPQQWLVLIKEVLTVDCYHLLCRETRPTFAQLQTLSRDVTRSFGVYVRLIYNKQSGLKRGYCGCASGLDGLEGRIHQHELETYNFKTGKLLKAPRHYRYFLRIARFKANGEWLTNEGETDSTFHHVAIIPCNGRLQTDDEILFARLLAYFVEAVITVIFCMYDRDNGDSWRQHEEGEFAAWGDIPDYGGACTHTSLLDPVTFGRLSKVRRTLTAVETERAKAYQTRRINFRNLERFTPAEDQSIIEWVNAGMQPPLRTHLRGNFLPGRIPDCVMQRLRLLAGKKLVELPEGVGCPKVWTDSMTATLVSACAAGLETVDEVAKTHFPQLELEQVKKKIRNAGIIVEKKNTKQARYFTDREGTDTLKAIFNTPIFRAGITNKLSKTILIQWFAAYLATGIAYGQSSGVRVYTPPANVSMLVETVDKHDLSGLQLKRAEEGIRKKINKMFRKGVMGYDCT